MRSPFKLLISATMLILTLFSGAALAHAYQVEVNGRPVTDADPIMYQGQLMAWSRPLAAALGLDLRWDALDRRLDLGRSGRQVAYWLGSRTVFRDGVRLQAPVPLINRSGKAYVPVWYTAALFGDQVTWDGQTMRIRTAVGQGGGSGSGGGSAPGTPLDGKRFYFPFPAGAHYQRDFDDNYGAGREWGADGNSARSHDGVDILAPKGTPVVAAGSGRVIRYGWNEYGGWRLTVELDAAPGWRFYYAHLNGYGPNLYEGARVQAGQLIGYVGNTGYGPVGTQGKFVPHLHFGIYRPDWSTINPFPYLKQWQSNQIRLP